MHGSDRLGTEGFGLMAGTPVATPAGWRAVADLRRGDPVLTVETGPRPIRSVSQGAVPANPVLLVPQGALGNRDPLWLLPGQPVLIEAELAEDLYGDPLALLPAAALQGWRGISRHAPQEGEAVIHLGFEAPQVIYASRALLLPCPGQDRRWPDTGTDLILYPLPQARHLVACLMAEDLGRAFRRAGLVQAAV